MIHQKEREEKEKEKEKEKEIMEPEEQPINRFPLETPPPTSRSASLTMLPISVLLIVGMEFCERFCFYGMRAVLYVYFEQYFGLSEKMATLLFHVFVMAAYCFPVMGGIVSDNYLGKFHTILDLSLVYVVGNLILSVTSIPGLTGDPPKLWGAIIGLALIALGTGGIKPCVSSFGGDQIDASNAVLLQLYFSLFYFSINTGSVLSTIVTPILRSTPCLGSDTCFPLAFGIPGALMVVATVIFVAGRPRYQSIAPEKNVFVKVCASIFYSLSAACCGPSIQEEPVRLEEHSSGEDGEGAGEDRVQNPGVIQAPSSHWMDRSKPRYGNDFVEDVKAFLRILLVLTPAPFFWTLFDQSASKWVKQATEMDRRVIGEIYLPPDLMQVCNPLFILLLIPVFEKLVYPALRKLFAVRPLQRMGIGLILTVLSFAVAGILQIWIDKGRFEEDPSDPDCTRCCKENCINIMAQIPQYLILTAGEVMFSITGLEFAYSQAPKTLKSVCSAYWLLTVAVGNLLVIIIAGSDLFRSRAHEFFFYAGMLLLVALVFFLLARRYVYVEQVR